MDHSLINPNQLRHHGVVVNDNPYEVDPTKSMGIRVDDNDQIPFQSKGSMIFFNTRYPDDEEQTLTLLSQATYLGTLMAWSCLEA